MILKECFNRSGGGKLCRKSRLAPLGAILFTFALIFISFIKLLSWIKVQSYQCRTLLQILPFDLLCKYWIIWDGNSQLNQSQTHQEISASAELSSMVAEQKRCRYRVLWASLVCCFLSLLALSFLFQQKKIKVNADWQRKVIQWRNCSQVNFIKFN